MIFYCVPISIKYEAFSIKKKKKEWAISRRRNIFDHYLYEKDALFHSDSGKCKLNNEFLLTHQQIFKV